MSVRETDKNDDIYVGIEFPLGYSPTGFFNPTKTIRQQAKSNIRNLLLTQKGERVFQPEFGTNLRSLLFEQITNQTIDKINDTIIEAIKNWLPYVIVNDLFVVQPDENLNQISISLEYSTTIEPDALDSITFDIQVGE